MLGKVRTLLEWTDDLLSKMWDQLDWVVPLGLLWLLDHLRCWQTKRGILLVQIHLCSKPSSLSDQELPFFSGCFVTTSFRLILIWRWWWWWWLRRWGRRRRWWCWWSSGGNHRSWRQQQSRRPQWGSRQLQLHWMLWQWVNHIWVYLTFRTFSDFLGPIHISKKNFCCCV